MYIRRDKYLHTFGNFENMKSPTQKTRAAAPKKSKLDKLIESRFGVALDYNKLTRRKAADIIAVINESLASVRQSSKLHTAHSDPRYTEMMMVKESLCKYMKEYKPSNAPSQKSAPKLTPVKAQSTSRSAVSEMASGRNYRLITQAVKLASAGKPVPGKCMEGFVPLLRQIAARRLTEGEQEKSEVILAAKDMVDTLQDMIEDLSRMVNEQMPPMLDSIRDQIGSEQADQFGQAVSQTLTTLLDSARTSREQVDAAARSLTGEQAAPMSMPADAGNQAPAPEVDLGDETGDEFGASDAAAGGSMPMGRAER